MMKIQILNTIELDQKQINGILNGLRLSLNINSTGQKLLDYFKKSSLGYCFHALALTNDEVVGHTLIYPVSYIKGDDEYILGQSGSTFILEGFRTDVFLYKRMFENLTDYVKKFGVRAILAVSNKNSYLYTIKFLKFKHLGNLKYYGVFTPYFVMDEIKIYSNLMRLLPIPFYILFSPFILKFSRKKNFSIQLNKSDNYYRMRLQNDRYSSISYGKLKVYYTISIDEGRKILYIMRVDSFCSNFADELLHRLILFLKLCLMDVSLILEVGNSSNLFNKNMGFLSRFTNRKLPFSVLLLDEIEITYNNIEYGLLNFDAR